jgi:hypothetical protein
MEIESVFFDSKWHILTELSHSSLSPTELAEKTGTSLANISTQLRLLEALDFIEKERLTNTAKGEPRKRYSLKKEFAYLVLGTKSAIGKKMFKLDNDTMPFFTVWMINDNISPFLIMRICLEHELQIKDAVSFGFLGRQGEELEILIIHEHPELLGMFNDKHIQRGDKAYRVKAHIHTSEQFQKGFGAKDPFFVNLVKRVFVLSEKSSFLSKLKKGAT